MAGPSISAATPGLSRLAQALAGGGSAYQRGYDDEVTAQTKIAQALASIRASDSTAAFNEAKTAEQRRANQLASPTALRDQAMLRVGAPTEAADDVDTFLNTGRIDKYNTGGQQGPVMPAPAWAQDQNLGSIAKQIAASQAVLGGSAKGADDYFKGQNQQFETELARSLVNGGLDKGAQSRGLALLKATPLFNSDASGGVLDQYGGGYDTSNPMAQSTIQVKKEQAGAQRASAANSYASAGEHRARAGEIQTGMSGGGKAPTGYRWNGGALEPIPGGPADPATKGAKLAKPPTEGQAKALMFGARMAVADETLGDLEKQGNRLPNVVKQGAEKVPLIGSALGMGANFFTTDGQQQVEQAQRDFINAVLRRESGAAIAESEFANAQRQYFAQPGDSPAVLRQKAANRQTAIAGMKAEFGEQSLPEFENIVSTARAGRRPVAKPASGGASGDFGAPTGRNVTVDY